MKCYFLSKRKAFDLRIDIGQLKLNMKKKIQLKLYIAYIHLRDCAFYRVIQSCREMEFY